MSPFRFPYVLTLSLSLLSLGAVGCSHGSSPTEPAFDESSPAAATASVTTGSSLSGEKRHGADDPAGDDRGGQSNGGNSGGGNGGNGNSGRGRGGADDPSGDDNGGRRGGRGGANNPSNPSNPRPNRGSEFEAGVVSVSGNTLNLAGGLRVTVNGATVWNARGDLRTLAQVSTAVGRNRPVRAEGRGTRQADGSFLAQTLKVEVDD